MFLERFLRGSAFGVICARVDIACRHEGDIEQRHVIEVWSERFEEIVIHFVGGGHFAECDGF